MINKSIWLWCLVGFSIFPLSSFSQNADLGKIFPKRYITGSFGSISTRSQLIFATSPDNTNQKVTSWDKSFSLGFGYRLNAVKSNFYLEYHLNNNIRPLHNSISPSFSRFDSKF